MLLPYQKQIENLYSAEIKPKFQDFQKACALYRTVSGTFSDSWNLPFRGNDSWRYDSVLFSGGGGGVFFESQGHLSRRIYYFINPTAVKYARTITPRTIR